jgi:DNA repair protein RAD51
MPEAVEIEDSQSTRGVDLKRKRRSSASTACSDREDVSSPTQLLEEPACDRADGPLPLDRLRAPESAGGAGLTSSDISRLIENGFTTVESIAFTPLRKLLGAVKSIGEAKQERMKAAASKLVPMGFQSANESLQQRRDMIRLSTGSSSLDALLHGGIETGSLTEIIGEFKSGKTQLCHTLAITAQLPVGKGGAAGKVIYIDTEGTFRPERVVEIAKKYSMNPETSLANIVIARAYNSDHQLKLLVEATNVMAHGARFALLIVDSATALFRSDFSGRGELAERQQSLSRFLRMLQRIADEYGTAILLTNQVIANVDQFGGPAPASKPAGGHIIAHASQTRLVLRKGMAEKRICKVFDSPVLPESEATFYITENGIGDAPTKPKGRGSGEDSE